MPCMVVHRNFPIENEMIGTLQDRFSSIIEEVLHKPKDFIMIIVDDEKPIRFGGSDEPALLLEVKSIGLPGDSPSRLSRELCRAAEHLVSVPQNRIYIEFRDVPRDQWGWDGSTF